MAYEKESAINKVVIKCKPEDYTANQKLFEESLARYYMTGACFDTALFERILAEIREDKALCKVYTTDDSLCAEIADGVEAGELLAWKLLNKNSFSNEFDSIACIGEAVLKRFPNCNHRRAEQFNSARIFVSELIPHRTVWTDTQEYLSVHQIQLILKVCLRKIKNPRKKFRENVQYVRSYMENDIFGLNNSQFVDPHSTKSWKKYPGYKPEHLAF